MTYNQQHVEALGYLEQHLDGVVDDEPMSAYLWIPLEELAGDLADGLDLTVDAATRLIAEMVTHGLLVDERHEDGHEVGMTTAGADALGYGHEYTVR